MGNAHIVKRTVFGRHGYAIVGNHQAALSGDSGTVFGPRSCALIIQFLESGLLLLDVGIGTRMVLVGQVLVVAEMFDVLCWRATGERLTWPQTRCAPVRIQ